ncbi:MAG TPA: hypothetical protein VHX37_11835 [Acidobacteriaceae bacterium]|jgi:hypothetical protein|nr:hypothetical protein [Acidobacteriaceae bacterium]
MVSRSVLAACVLAACLTLSCPSSSSAQSQTSSTTQNAPAPTSPSQPTLQLQDLPPEPHTPTPAELDQERQQRALAAAERLANMQAHWGPDMSTPGLAISLTEVGREKQPDGSTQVTYHVTGSGFSPGDRLSLVRWPLDAESYFVMGGIAIDASGTAVCGAPLPPTPNAPGQPGTAPATQPPSPPPPSCTASMKAGDPLVVMTSAAPGEPVRVALIGADRKHGAATTAVPFPLANEDKGCKLSVLLGVKNAAMVLVEGTGFPPNTALNLESITEDQTRTLAPKTNGDGRMIIIVLPASKGQEAGDTTVRFSGVAHVPSLATSASTPAADPDCKPSVTFHWGKGSYKLD